MCQRVNLHVPNLCRTSKEHFCCIRWATPILYYLHLFTYSTCDVHAGFAPHSYLEAPRQTAVRGRGRQAKAPWSVSWLSPGHPFLSLASLARKWMVALASSQGRPEELAHPPSSGHSISCVSECICKFDGLSVTASSVNWFVFVSAECLSMF